MVNGAAKQPPKITLAVMHEWAGRIPESAARGVRDAVVKEWDADARAHDSLLTRRNQLLAAAGVATSLLVGLAKQAGIDSTVERVLFVLALGAVVVAAVFVLLALLVRTSKTAAKAAVLLGQDIAPISLTRPADAWTHDYDRFVALHYCEIRIEGADRHRLRAGHLERAQWSYIVFLGFAAALGVALPL